MRPFFSTRRRPTPSSRRRCRAQCNVDRISQLPDDILVDIISHLSLMEGARTSVLSSRWMNVWKYNPFLNFDVDSALDTILREKNHGIRKRMLCILRHEYIEWVNRVIQSNKAPILKQFRISFPLDKTYKDAITQWLEFAFTRQVQRLEFDLKNYTDPPKYYYFPKELIAPDNKMRSKSLRELCLKNIDVTATAVEFFLNNCPLLEKLVIHASHKMSELQVCGYPSLMLKHLEIVDCMNLKSLKVSVPSLTSLRTSIPTSTGLVLANVPMLVDVSLSCHDDEDSLRRVFSALSCCVSQLEILSLLLIGVRKGNIDVCKFVELPKLKKLEIEYFGRGDESLGTVAALIRSSPYMEEFVLKNEWTRSPEVVGEEVKEVKSVVKSPHHHLKIVEFSGFCGRDRDREMVSNILENCVALTKLIIDPKRRGVCEIWDTPEVEQIARNNANQVLQVPAHVELLIL